MMDRIFISSDYHLWNKKNDEQHPERSRSTLEALKTHLPEGMTEDDCWIYLGDLCDPEVADEKYLRELISSVPARRIMCRGNNDTASANWYYNLGFDDVVDVVRVHNILFSHKPIRVAPDELNIHGHLHGEIWSELGYKYITVYDDNLAEHHPVTLDDILRDAAPPLTRNPDYSMWEKDSTSPLYTAVDGGTKADSILDLSKEFVLIPVDEAALPDSKIPYGTSGGWYNTEPGREGVWEPKATIGKKTYREVANILIVKNLAKNPLVYVVPKSNGEYSIPGGGTNPKETMAQSAMREAEEEAHIVTKNVNYYGQFILTPKELGWSGPMHYTGGKSVHVFAGEYERPYRGKVAEVDQDDNVLNNGRWVPVKDAIKHLHPKYAEALADYCGITKIESSSDIVDEACKNVAEARKFVAEVGKLAGKYDANYFVVTDGASGIHNSGNPAVKAARDAHVKWELANGGNPDEDWSTGVSETADKPIDESIVSGLSKLLPAGWRAVTGAQFPIYKEHENEVIAVKNTHPINILYGELTSVVKMSNGGNATIKNIANNHAEHNVYRKAQGKALDVMVFDVNSRNNITTGKPVHAVKDGEVVYANGSAGSPELKKAFSNLIGNAVVIKHGKSEYSIYAHLSRASCGVGKHVAKGDVIGLCGNTGNSSEPHLHFQMSSIFPSSDVHSGNNSLLHDDGSVDQSKVMRSRDIKFDDVKYREFKDYSGLLYSKNKHQFSDYGAAAAGSKVRSGTKSFGNARRGYVIESAYDIIDEVIFPDIDSTRYFESDDEYHKRKAEKAEKEDSSVVAVEESVLFDPQLTGPLCELNESIRHLSIDLAEASQEMSYSSSQEVVNGVPVKDKESLTVKNGRKKPVKIVKDNLQESTFADVKQIIGTLSNDERKLLYHGGSFVDSPNVIYREVSHTDKPGSTGGFVEVYKFNDDPSTGIMVLAVSPHDRGTGLSDNLIANSISPLSGMGVKRIFCRVVNGNTHSMDMLERNEFTKLSSDNHYTKYARDIEHLVETADPHAWGTTREYAYEKFMNLAEPVDEGTLPIPIYKLLHPEAGRTVELFHGTNVKYKTLEPVAMDFGNQFTRAGWSVFMWDNYDMAKRWALFVTCRELRIQGNGLKGHIRFMKTAVNDAHLLVSPEDLAEFKAYMANNVVNMYIFHAHIPIDEIDIGNDSTHDEFTVRRSVKPDKIDTIRITPKLLDDFCEIMPENHIEQIRKLNKKNMRGFVSPLLNHDYYWVKTNHEDLIDRINGDLRSGRLRPGVDDLEQYFEDNDIIIPTVPLKDRMYRFKPLKLDTPTVDNLGESASDAGVMGMIFNLNRMLNKMEYGLLHPGQKKIPPRSLRNYNTTSEDYDRLWKMASPAQFISQNGGICWDYVTYEADYFKRHFNNIPFTTYYIQFNDGGDNPTHTFMTFELNGKHYWFESSFKKVMGIWEAPSDSDLIARVIYEMDRYDTNHGHSQVLSEFPYEIFTYDATDHRIHGLGCEEFMDWVHANGTPYNDKIDLKNARKARLIEDASKIAPTLSEAAIDDFAKYNSNHHRGKANSLSSYEKRFMDSDDIKRHRDESEMVDGCLPTNRKDKNYAIGWFDGYGTADEKLVAMVRVCQYHKNGETYYGISRLYVAPEYRGHDLGSQALKAAQDLGGTRLYVRNDNRVAKEMYERRGFREYYRSRDGKYIGMRSDAGPVTEAAGKKLSSRLSMDGQGSGHSNPLDDREKRESIADKYGLRDVGNTHEEDEYEETDIERRRKERLKNLRKANRVRRWKRFKRRIKRFFTGKNESTADVDDNGTWIDHSHEEEDYLVGVKEPFFEHPDRYKDAEPNLEGAVITMEDNVTFNDRINETSASGKLKPVYVVLIHSGTKLATAIKTLTGAQYTHASISFDPSLEHMYSFGAFEDKSRGRFANGFKMENFRSPWFQSRDISYAVYMVPCTANEYEMMERRLSYFIRNDTKFRFNKLGLLKNFLGIFDNPQYRFFCSQFVADILHAGRPESDFLENPGKLRPIDFTKFEDAIYVDGGEDMRLYDSRVVIEKTAKLLRAAEMKRKIYNENISFDINGYNPWASEILDYQLRAMDESETEDFMAYVSSLKARDGSDGKVVFGPHDVDIAWDHYLKVKESMEKAANEGNTMEVKNCLRRLDAIVGLLERYAMGNGADHGLTTSALRARNSAMNTMKTYIRQIKTIEPDYNHRLFCDSSSYGRRDFPERMVYPAGCITMIDC